MSFPTAARLVFFLAFTIAMASCKGSSSRLPIQPVAALPPPQASPASAAAPATNGAGGAVLALSRQSRFIWPAAGPITTYFGPGHPTGIDIGLDPSVDSPIRASSAGTVTTAGGSVCCGYGRMVEIESGSTRTLYAHLESIAVSAGQEIKQGEIIGLGGSTGASDGKHLHFELYESGVVLDPLRFLPAAQETFVARGEFPAACTGSAIQVEPASRFELRLLDGDAPDAQLEHVSLTMGERAAARRFTIETSASDNRTIALTVPPAPAALGETYDASLEMTVASGEERRVIACELTLKTWKTLPNPPVVRRVAGTPTPVPPTPTPTPIFWTLPTLTPGPIVIR
jgi:hypothetical protein